MKRVITAIGNEKLNNILRRQTNIIIESPDIQYQEGIIEALDKYQEVDTVILYENIIGELELEDLIRSITIIKNDIEIILIVDEELSFNNKQVLKVVKNNENYVNNILGYFENKEYIISQNINLSEFQKVDNIIQNKDNPKQRIVLEKKYKKIKMIYSIKENISKVFEGLKKREKQKNVITVIGNYGAR